jgi:rhamnogalacturonan endolyase
MSGCPPHTKGNPGLVADIFGDWREELLVRTADSSAIRIYLSTEVTDHKLYTLMHDPQYRAGVARQNTGYNQPAYTSFYFASDTDWENVPIPNLRTPGALSVLQNEMDEHVENGELTGPLVSQLTDTLRQAKHHLEKGSMKEATKFMEKYLFHINRKSNQDNISTEAKRNLSYHSQTLIKMWENQK